MTDSPKTPPTCPFHVQSTEASQSLTRRAMTSPPLAGGTRLDERGIYRVQEFQSVRDVLRSEAVVQAGFMAEATDQLGGLMRNRPVLFADGEEHHAMRRDTAKYFTPVQVGGYGPMIAALADELVGELATTGQADLDDLSLRLAVDVAAQVVGLTSSLAPGMGKRVGSFITGGGDSEPGSDQTQTRMQALAQQANLALFYMLDVKPAILSRRKRRRDDLISHLLDQDYNDLEILTECITYGTAGMVTTREFISVAAWHLLHDAELRADYVHGTETRRIGILHEILRLEPVITTLYRRVAQELRVGGQTLPEGSLIALSVQGANNDQSVVGENAGELCPGRDLPRGVQAPAMSFGDGHHRCPGAYLAVRESDVFLRRLLIWPGVHIVREPTLSFNEVSKGYELRGFTIGMR
ncbi:cytochrome P450 [Deinococcus sp.]|uniref:cytochrome P450 n=1 Tax=Deinococcus sp. TaxID=47478 RepID=UPI0025E68EC7|nr:cytochrome P450 [Deinococcus sp.]